MSKDRDYIKEMFDRDGIKAPESLSEENILKMLEAADAEAHAEAAGDGSALKTEANTHEKSNSSAQPEQNETKTFEKRRAAGPVMRRVIAVAAVALVAVFGISGMMSIMQKAPDTSEVGGELYTFKSEKEIERLLLSLDDSPRVKLFGIGNSNEAVEREYSTMTEEADADFAAGDSAASSEAKTLSAAGGDSGGESHSETYRQVDEVDEADIVKTDGRYIYFVNSKREVVILSAKDGKTKKLSTIGSSGIENYIHDIYLKGDTLVTVGTVYKEDSDEAASGVVIYDISDRKKPEYVCDFSQTGEIVTSRMVGDYVYLVTNDYVQRGGRPVPMCGIADDFAKLQASDIKCVPDPRSNSYIVLSAVDISAGRQGRAATKAVLGASSDVYCNDHNLYSASYEWDSENNTEYTRIVRAGLSGLDVKFDATARVRGNVLNQFAMDEKDGYFRIATTSYRDGIDVNNLFVLDKKLKEAGKVTGFARNESIKAVRYMGSKAYVITYEAIDPLFIIDLSDPADPRIEGEVKIDGFSTLLVPISNSRLLGIGHATGDNGYGGQYASGLKLALFDISDPSEPKVIDSKEFNEMSSPAQYDHHALTVNEKEGYYAVPYEIYHYAETDDVEIIEDDMVIDDAEAAAGDEYTEEPFEAKEEDKDWHEAGILVFKADDKINSEDQHKLDGEQLLRSVYIGDWLYALDADGNVQSFRPYM